MQDNIETIHDMYYGDGEFEFVKDNSTKEFLKNAGGSLVTLPPARQSNDS